MDKKLSFSISSKPASAKPNRNPLKTSHTFNNEGHENEDNSLQRFITEFDSSDKTHNSDQDSSKTQKRIIAPIQNEYNPGKRMKNLDLPLRSAARSGGDVDFEPESSADAANEGAGTNMSYGLNVRQSGNNQTGQTKHSIDSVLLKKLKDDINRLPEDDEGFDQFEEVPIEGYGAALLSGYGWKDGMGIGKSAKEDVKVVEYKRWAGRGGLGAFSDVDVTTNQKEIVKEEVKQVNKEQVRVSAANKREKDSNSKVSRKKEERRVSKGSWLNSHIKVRVISKRFKGGRYYLKKGKVLDVVGPTTCDVCMDDDKEIIQGVEQDVLETALPRSGGYVLVLSGKYKGVYGSLVKKDSERETGVVQDSDTRDLLNVRLDQIAEYVGDPSDIGY